MTDKKHRMERMLERAAADTGPQPDVRGAVMQRIATVGNLQGSASSERTWMLATGLTMAVGLLSLLSVLPLAGGMSGPLAELAMVALGR